MSGLSSAPPNAPGAAPIFACRAWVNFNGSGVVEILASGNVRSITDNGPGDYTVNFDTPMPDADYAVTGMTQSYSVLETANALCIRGASTTGLATQKDTDGVRLLHGWANADPRDGSNINVAIFR